MSIHTQVSPISSAIGRCNLKEATRYACDRPAKSALHCTDPSKSQNRKRASQPIVQLLFATHKEVQHMMRKLSRAAHVVKKTQILVSQPERMSAVSRNGMQKMPIDALSR